MVFGDDGPAVAQRFHVAAAQVDHRFDGEDHSRLQLFARARLAVVQHLRVFVKALAHAVAAVFAHHRQAVPFGKFLDDVADVAQPRAGAHLHDAQPHGLIRQAVQPPRGHRAFAQLEHAAGVAKPAVFDDGDVHIQHVAFFQGALVGDAVAHHVIDGGAHVPRIGRIARRLVADGGRARALLLHVLRGQPVDFKRGDTGADVRRDGVQHFRGQAARFTHGGNACRVFDDDAHGAAIIVSAPRAMPLTHAFVGALCAASATAGLHATLSLRNFTAKAIAAARQRKTAFRRPESAAPQLAAYSLIHETSSCANIRKSQP